MERNAPCWCGSGKKWKKCHYPVSVIDPSLQAKRYLKDFGIRLKTAEQLEGIYRACQLSARILDELCRKAARGVTTQELDELSRRLHREEGAAPAPLGYGTPPYPKTICTSLNEVICHGIPDERPLQDGDILNIDTSCLFNGYFGDCSRMVSIGSVSAEKQLVVDVSFECMQKAISICGPGVPISAIGQTIEDFARSKRCSVVNQFVGHGIGLSFHEPPDVPHHYNDLHIPMVPGMVFTIEPMINAGSREAIIDLHDQWTARTKDGKPSAQWEHTILITETGHKVLTQLA